MGTRGPVPKRSDERAGHRAKSDQPDKVASSTPVVAPPADEEWHPQAKRWYDSLHQSLQVRYFEPSDWEYARTLATLLSDELYKARRSSEILKAVLSGMSNLGTTEADRRRMRIEIDRPDPNASANDEGKVAALDRYRRLAGDG